MRGKAQGARGSRRSSPTCAQRRSWGGRASSLRHAGELPGCEIRPRRPPQSPLSDPETSRTSKLADAWHDEIRGAGKEARPNPVDCHESSGRRRPKCRGPRWGGRARRLKQARREKNRHPGAQDAPRDLKDRLKRVARKSRIMPLAVDLGPAAAWPTPSSLLAGPPARKERPFTESPQDLRWVSRTRKVEFRTRPGH